MSLRILASILCLCLALPSFLFGYEIISGYVFIAMFLWVSGFVFLMLSVVVLFHRPSGFDHRWLDGRRAVIRTDHEVRIDTEGQRERELLNVRLDQHMVDRKW